MSNKAIQLLAPAKINLGLWVIGKLPDGYHEIRTLFYKLDWGDTITIKPSTHLKVTSSKGPQGRENIVHKAIQLLSERTGMEINLNFHIEKKIHIGAGLGGGSSDAAAALKGAVKLLDIKISRDELIQLGAEVGSDVPFFMLDSRAAIGRGKGDRLEPVDLTFPEGWIIELKCPKISVSTGQAYRKIASRQMYSDENEAELAIQKIIEAIRNKDLNLLAHHLYNSFEKVMLQEYHEIKSIKDEFLSKGGVALMTGSGSCVYGIFESSDHLKT